MPKKPMDYSKACIYKIACKDPDITDVYVGSTTNLSKRRYSHKNDCNNCDRKGYNLNVYKFIREHGGFENWNVVKLEDYPCESYEELAKRERYWFEELGATLNRCVPSRTESEYNKQYHQQNRDKILEQMKQYREQNRDKILEQMKQRYEQNRNKILKKKKQRYEQNKDKLKEKFECECGSSLRISDKARHLRSIKHQNYLKTLE